jgi:hypothetical protein
VRRWGEWEPGISMIRKAANMRPSMDRDLVDRIVGPPLVQGR